LRSHQLPELMHDADSFHLMARGYVVTHMRDFALLYAPFAPLRDGEDYDGYLIRMARDGEWVEGEIEVTAAARVFNVTVHLFGYDAQHDQSFGPPRPDSRTRDVRLAHYHDVHYRAIERA